MAYADAVGTMAADRMDGTQIAVETAPDLKVSSLEVTACL